ncbi:hypothetical protein FB466_1359 [Klugiella xanthotipulae]|uniref:Uncharacterized protein n=2 Tax=Klugiella xanthotipulae TaxID=244735 RepID=A0A543HXS5_9MICO|nr:hypothetical protein FB466_1359 [Klugiella xanthotipulae]
MRLGSMRPGIAPTEALPSAAKAAATLAILESSDLRILGGLPHIIVRFTVEDTEIALQVAAHITATTDNRVEVLTTTVTRLTRGRWQPAH